MKKDETPKEEKKEVIKKDEKETHKKPTKEELDKGIEENLEKLEKDDEEVKKEIDEKIKESEKEPEEEDQEPIDPDYKKKFVESSKEALILHEKNKQVNKSIEEAMSTPEPIEEELKKEYGEEWEVMSDFEKKMAKESLWNNKRFAQLDNIAKTNKDMEAWTGKVQEFIDDPANLNKHPALEGKTDDFLLFASKPSRRNIDFDTLVGAFLYDASLKSPKGNKGGMFPEGSGGDNKKPTRKDNKLTLEESRVLQQTDYKKWLKYHKAGMIQTEIE